ncbi:DUF4381 domain-containing protein [Thalassotalea euphylliae]|uniref:DUF4381 domain-containing protein n=1 Tax=Thalassotalea euphylliae TaxID=1655234 RepID=UPI00363F8674
MDPLAQLNDIHLPQQIHNYPVAIGWWILLACIIALVIYITMKVKQHRQRVKIKKRILVELAKSTSQERSSELLKVALIHYFPRAQVANLHSSGLVTFMRDHIPASKAAEFETLSSDHFSSLYQKGENNNVAAFNKALMYWVSHALPTKKKHALKNEEAMKGHIGAKS